MRFIFLCLLLVSCVTKNVYETPKFILPKIEHVKVNDPSTMPLDPNVTKDGSWVIPIEAGSCTTQVPKPCPEKSGLLFSEEKAVRSQLYEISYKELKKVHDADAKFWLTEQELYEDLLQQTDKEIKALQPTWLMENALSLGISGGFLLGLITTGIILKLQ